MRTDSSAWLLTVVLGCALVPAARAEQCAGVDVVEQIAGPQGSALMLNGAGLREAWFGVDVYVAALYLPRRQTDPRLILDSPSPSVLQLHLVRDVAASDMQSNIGAAFARAVAGDDAGRFEPELKRLIASIPTLKAGSVFELRVVGTRFGRSLRVAHADREVAQFDDEAFARTLLAIWLGDHPVSLGLKAQLLGADCDAD